MSEDEDKPKKAWNSEKGRFARMDPEEHRELSRKAGLKAGETHRRKAELRAKLKDKEGMLNEAVGAVMAENPELLQQVFTNIANKAADPNDDKSLAAAEMLLKHSGITAPKQQEVVVEQKKDIKETVNELENLGVDITGLKVLNGGKE